MTDQKIIELIRNERSDISLAQLYKHFPIVCKMILSKGGGIDDAEDIFQEALIILIRKIKERDFKLTAQLGTYLYGVCHFLWKDELKKRMRYDFCNFETGLTDSVEQELNETLDAENLAKLAEKVIGDLKERCQELLLLFYEGRMKLKDIANKMGYSSENTAKNQKYKCLEAARSRLKELKQAI